MTILLNTAYRLWRSREFFNIIFAVRFREHGFAVVAWVLVGWAFGTQRRNLGRMRFNVAGRSFGQTLHDVFLQDAIALLQHRSRNGGLFSLTAGAKESIA